ncbi:FecR family protein [uncultured Sphingomonas sp.]|uniref:FecR family protein n=1 Tax=uncultured Sphingomonas sp. TaxID=158754 RepID=UPI0035CAA824
MRDRIDDGLIGDFSERAIWAELEGLRGGDTMRDSRRFVAGLKAGRERRGQWLARWRGLVPASGLAVAAAALLLTRPEPVAETLRTQVGEMRRETLGDGTIVLLNTDTRMRVTFRDDGREVVLLAGQARFDVAHDAARPFRVSAGAMTVTAVGTAFDVVALPSRTAVTLIEGKVLVRTDDRVGTVRSRPNLLTPGQQMTIMAGRLSPPRSARLDAALAWQRSYIDLGDMSLTEALDEVNRYSRTKIVVDTPGLDSEEIGGVFKAGDVDAVVEALSAYFELKVIHRDPDKIVLGRARAHDPITAAGSNIGS